ncbi:hypothetical protein [Mesorhizobium sp. M0203]|uniref:hypothetical protein n=1 Tax=Mesorhizobium sp. M0203 TaxID=2956912 RepID=UPI00333ADD10
MRTLLCEAAQCLLARVTKWPWLKAWAMSAPIQERSKSPRETSEAGRVEYSKVLDLNTPNREGRQVEQARAYRLDRVANAGVFAGRQVDGIV